MTVHPRPLQHSQEVQLMNNVRLVSVILVVLGSLWVGSMWGTSIRGYLHR
jgi:hypothetical protein